MGKSIQHVVMNCGVTFKGKPSRELRRAWSKLPKRSQTLLPRSAVNLLLGLADITHSHQNLQLLFTPSTWILNVGVKVGFHQCNGTIWDPFQSWSSPNVHQFPHQKIKASRHFKSSTATWPGQGQWRTGWCLKSRVITYLHIWQYIKLASRSQQIKADHSNHCRSYSIHQRPSFNLFRKRLR